MQSPIPRSGYVSGEQSVRQRQKSHLACGAWRNHAGVLRCPLPESAEGAPGLCAVQLHSADWGTAPGWLDNLFFGA
ncbi:unnamed protein product [Caretta caretta]